MAAVKAVTAAQLAMAGGGEHTVSYVQRQGGNTSHAKAQAGRRDRSLQDDRGGHARALQGDVAGWSSGEICNLNDPSVS
jgi:hypothetical protein